ncbi:MAG: hypothetical protein V4773_00700 [Verrucomicrobiota bacterium]
MFNSFGGARRAGIAFLLGVALCGALGAAEETRVLFGEANGFRAKDLERRGVAVAVEGGRLKLTAPVRQAEGERRAMSFPLHETERDLARFQHVEVEIANLGKAPVSFSLWALSGLGWGGVSTFSTTQTAAGREVLAAGARAVYRIDLHAKYSGRDVYTKAIDPAAVQRLELVLENEKMAVALELGVIRAIGSGPATPHDTSKRVRVPWPTHETPAAGRRVYQKLPGWEKTDVTHVLTLPREWRPGGRWPVIVEYTGNVFYHKFCYSTGRTEQGNLAYGLARGEGFITLNLPFISEDGRREQVDGWGDIDKAIAYCHAALDFVEQQYGADRRAVFFTGFSRGSYAANYLALRDDKKASEVKVERAIQVPDAKWPSEKTPGWRGVAVGWNERAGRMNGRPWFHQPDELGAEVHVDSEFLEDRPATVATRAWLRERAAQALK